MTLTEEVAAIARKGTPDERVNGIADVLQRIRRETVFGGTGCRNVRWPERIRRTKELRAAVLKADWRIPAERSVVENLLDTVIGYDEQDAQGLPRSIPYRPEAL